MLKKTIKYTDFNDVEQTEDVYFHLSKAELVKLEASHSTIQGEKVSGGFREKLEAIVKAGNGREIMNIFEEIIDMSYGVRSEDGKRFNKSKALTEEFKTSAAYDEFFMEIVTDAEKAAQFVNGIVPADIAKAMAEQDTPSGPPVSILDVDTAERKDALGQPAGEVTTEHVDVTNLTQDEINEIIRKRSEQ